MTVAEVIEKLMALGLDSTIEFFEVRYMGGGPEAYSCGLSIVNAHSRDEYSNHYVITPRPDREFTMAEFDGQTLLELEL